MRKIPMVILAATAFFGTGLATHAQTPPVGDAPATATVGWDAAIARQREINRERAVTIGAAPRYGVNRGMKSDRMLPERFAPDAGEGAPAGR
jgi:hypothetical protein